MESRLAPNQQPGKRYENVSHQASASASSDPGAPKCFEQVCGNFLNVARSCSFNERLFRAHEKEESHHRKRVYPMEIVPLGFSGNLRRYSKLKH